MPLAPVTWQPYPKPSSHILEAASHTPVVFIRHVRTHITDLWLMSQAVTNIVGYIPGELDVVQLSKKFAG